MARESFEDAEVAAALNRSFVAVKVDREERPDVDAVYMAVCQALTGSGGWPLTILMTPGQKPFYAGTYLPKRSRYSMPGLLDLLETAADRWENDREELVRSGDEIARAFQPRSERKKEAGAAQNVIRSAYRAFERSFDQENGGFGGSPKFPAPHNLMFLLRYFYFEHEPRALEMAEKTLRQMVRGGIYDQIGYGFSRYSTDEKWLIPHFEKMLYDNALLVMAYLESYQITGKELYRDAVEQTLQYIRREMTHENGGFYSAQDADSEGEEGKYYVFTPDEMVRLLGEEDGAYFNRFFGISQQENFEGRSIPNRLGASEEDRPDERIARLIPKVYAYRRTRVRLHTDDKILTSWNALMIAALAKAYRILGEPEYLRSARGAMRFLLEQLADGRGGLSSCWRGGAFGAGNLEDYAFTVWALLELYEAAREPDDLAQALRLCRKIRTSFRDEQNGGFFLTAGDAEQLIFRPKETYDGALPSGNSVVGFCLTRLAALTGDPELEQAAAEQLAFLAAEAQAAPTGFSFALAAEMAAVYPGTELVAVLKDEEDGEQLRRMLCKKFRPDLSVLAFAPRNRDEILRVCPFAADYALKDGKSAYYVCRGHACSAPVASLAALEQSLS